MHRLIKSKSIILTVLLTFISGIITAQLRVPSIYCDHMVVQQNSDVPVWGWSEVNDQITVKASWDNIEAKAVGSHTNGRWLVKLKSPHAGGPFTIEIKNAYKTIVLSDVMVGEVWVCSGQSNMEFRLAGATTGKDEIAAATHAEVRFFKIPKTASEYPQDICNGSWVSSNAADMPDFSAVGYYFAKELSTRLNVTVGMINSSWGGSPIEVWIKSDLITKDSLLNAQALKKDDRWSPIKPGALFNSMINPISFYPVSGAIWYQGESNVDQYPTYSKLMQQLITCWRTEWKSDLSFYFVQIAPYTYKNGKSAYLREQQTLSRSIPNTGMVVISDLVSDTTDIHPKDKKEVGLRLANLALSKHYSVSGIVAESPYFKEMQLKGKELILSFTNCDNGLVFKPGKNSGFEIAGADSHYYSATIIVKGNLVSLSSKEVPNPVSVRYCFTDAALPTLFSKEGLPVCSFRAGK